MKPLRLAALVVALAPALPGWAMPLSAADARRALAEGAQAWDVRAANTAAAVIPGAAAVPRQALERWLVDGNHAALAAAVSVAGLDLSRDVVIYGEAGDRLAQALQEALARLATGRVHWLVGGIQEWQAAGLPTAAALAARAPVPQHLVWRGDGSADGPMAAPALRQGMPAPAAHKSVAAAPIS